MPSVPGALNDNAGTLQTASNHPALSPWSGDFKRRRMPIPVTKYRCDFKCGAKAVGDRRKMVSHEKNCLKNPENKSCMTCVNQVYDRDSTEEGGVFHMRGCKLERMERFFADIHESLVVMDSAYQHVRPLVHCPNWGKDAIVPWTEGYLSEIQPKIEKAQKERINANNLPF